MCFASHGIISHTSWMWYMLFRVPYKVYVIINFANVPSIAYNGMFDFFFWFSCHATLDEDVWCLEFQFYFSCSVTQIYIFSYIYGDDAWCSNFAFLFFHEKIHKVNVILTHTMGYCRRYRSLGGSAYHLERMNFMLFIKKKCVF